MRCRFPGLAAPMRAPKPEVRARSSESSLRNPNSSIALSPWRKSETNAEAGPITCLGAQSYNAPCSARTIHAGRWVATRIPLRFPKGNGATEGGPRRKGGWLDETFRAMRGRMDNYTTIERNRPAHLKLRRVRVNGINGSAFAPGILSGAGSAILRSFRKIDKSTVNRLLKNVKQNSPNTAHSTISQYRTREEANLPGVEISLSLRQGSRQSPADGLIMRDGNLPLGKGDRR